MNIHIWYMSDYPLILIPIDELIFFRGVGIPPTRYDILRMFHSWIASRPMFPFVKSQHVLQGSDRAMSRAEACADGKPHGLESCLVVSWFMMNF